MKTAPQKQRQKTQLSHYHELSHIADLMEIPAGFLTTYMFFSWTKGCCNPCIQKWNGPFKSNYKEETLFQALFSSVVTYASS